MSSSAEDYPRKEDKLEDEGTWVNAELLQEVLEEGAKVLRLHVQPAVGRGDNFLSVLYRTRVEYRTTQSDDLRVAHLIVKGIPPNEFIQTYIEDISAFKRETIVYREVLPRLYAFADATIGNCGFKKFSAGYYETSRPDTLILDDLRHEGFVMAPRIDRLNLSHCTLVVQTLAQMHALSAAYDEKNPGYISRFDSKLFSEKNRNRLKQFYPPLVDSLAKEIRTWGTLDHILDKLDSLKDTVVSKIIDICRPVELGRNVLAHGDCWLNNILFKYSETGQPIDLRFVDYQATHKASPALDLNFFLFSSPQTDVTMHHFDDLLQEYCDEFVRCAKALGYSGSMITFQEVRKEVNRMLFFGFISLMTTMAIVQADPDESPDLGGITEEELEKGGGVKLFEKAYASARFRVAFETLLPYFDERGVLE